MRKSVSVQPLPQAGRKLSEEKVVFAVDHLSLTKAEKKLNSVEQTESVQVVKKGLEEISHMMKEVRRQATAVLAEMPLKNLFRFQPRFGGPLLLHRAVYYSTNLPATRVAAVPLLGRRLPIHWAFAQAIALCRPQAVRQFLELGADPAEMIVKMAKRLCNPREKNEMLKLVEEVLVNQRHEKHL